MRRVRALLACSQRAAHGTESQELLKVRLAALSYMVLVPGARPFIGVPLVTNPCQHGRHGNRNHPAGIYAVVRTSRVLATRTGSSCEVAFTAFVKDFFDAMLRAAFVLLGSRQEAEDAVQVALLRTLRRWHKAQAAPEAYSRVVLVNICRERWRQRSRHPEVLGDAHTPGGQPELASFSDALERRYVNLGCAQPPPRGPARSPRLSLPARRFSFGNSQDSGHRRRHCQVCDEPGA
jgi:Sigma-70 region 2